MSGGPDINFPERNVVKFPLSQHHVPARQARRLYRHATPTALALAALLSLNACQKPAPVAPLPREVVVLPVQAGNGAQRLTLPAQVQARFSTPMSFRVAGPIIERRVHLGDTVRKGDIVARLDPADSEHNRASANADLESARQRLDNARQQLQRDTAQAREQLISPLQLEQTQDSYASALAQAKAAEARAALAGNQQRYTQLVAEHDGVISAEQANTGEVVAAGQPVFTLSWSGATDVITEAAESQVTKIQPGASATLQLNALPQQVLRGTVREISPAADPQSRTYRIKVTLDKEKNSALRLGMSGTVSIDTSHASNPAGMLIPATALFHKGNSSAVWIVNPTNGQLELRPVTVSAYGERSVTLSAGVSKGENIVVQGVHTLTAGEKVKPIAPLHAEDFAL
jgi:multidrug efflux system membrane fusion protein